ncbi:angiotensin-converting enzyme [Lingula anatina]|uniref:Angiotensin-converting enzyme n=1 Tax=Lingula anatina TaxID=7574 RepID=A0A1S3GZX9_LINAN|nr:angiotensin-converting enzyme [Lingula anatina]XP_013379234.1 angiotensin-converting enzyme [Lingula anatina]XP_013379235.1 angiotensin-converting enzyme [Lingula anatina]|eukprot:XP_013379232.1 angiotensin-converting enzyme [Lingula anatina]
MRLAIFTLLLVTGALCRSDEELREQLIDMLEDAFKVDKFSDGKFDAGVEEKAEAWLKDYNTKLAVRSGIACNLNWNYETNISNANAKKIENNQVEQAEWNRKKAQEAREWLKKKTSKFSEDTLRQFKLITMDASLRDDADVRRMSYLLSQMESIYDKGKVCRPHSEASCLPLEPDLVNLMMTSRDYDELLWAWKSWRDVTGPPIRDLYREFVVFQNKAAKENGFADMGEFWRISNFEDKNLDKIVDGLFDQVKPLYQQLHAYVRRKLINQYGEKYVSPTGPIPAHLLGNMWAQQWDLILDLLQPYPNVPSVDVTSALKKQNYTVQKMFKTAEAFFCSLGMDNMTKEFWEKSMVVKPTDGREVQCHASAEDFHNASDYRIKMCTEIDYDNLYVIHHEMGHVQYYMQYSHQPDIYRNGANAGFHEAVGDTIALSVATPEHLHKLKLLDDIGDDKELREKQDLNFLMKMALQKLAFLPFGLLIDKWRWDVFRGHTNASNYNQKWWDLRLRYQGIAPPVPRSELDFDPGAKFHVPANVPYIRYFVSFLIQFQFQRALCDAAGHTGPIHHCDIYQSTAAGEKLKKMLSLGSSRPWPDAMEVLTGQREIDPSAILEYFKPLQDFLVKENKNEIIGWEENSEDLMAGLQDDALEELKHLFEELDSE